MTNNVICFDLEGPLSPQDNAYEVMGLIDNGHRIFEVISRYDDILTIGGKEGYEPGDTLSLIVPFLLYHGISEKDIIGVSRRAKIVDGSAFLISRLKQLGWSPYIISTSYQQHAYNVGGQIGVPPERTYCTYLPLDELSDYVKEIDASRIKELEKDIIERLYPRIGDEGRIRDRLNRFYYKDILGTGLEDIMRRIIVIGGQRKVDATLRIAREAHTSLSEMIVVGDSITDYKMLRQVKEEKGVAVVFNGNRYAIPHANVGLASTDIRFLLIIITAHMCGGISGVIDTVKAWCDNHDEFVKNPGEIPDDLIPSELRDLLVTKILDPGFFPPHFHHIEGSTKEKREEILNIHAKSRALVRGVAAKLG
jgi:energy-converting hydrogenase A subunit R